MTFNDIFKSSFWKNITEFSATDTPDRNGGSSCHRDVYFCGL